MLMIILILVNCRRLIFIKGKNYVYEYKHISYIKCLYFITYNNIGVVTGCERTKRDFNYSL